MARTVMHDLLADIPLGRKQRGIVDPAVLRRLDAARCAPPRPPKVSAPVAPQGPHYEFWRPWYARLLPKRCARCGGAPQGWIQQQISTPYRFKRFVLWTVNLITRRSLFLFI